MLVLLIFSALLLGSFPSAVIVGRTRGVDPRREGSRNPGATNIARSAGALAGLIVLGLDLGKGWLAAGLLPGLLDQPGAQAAAIAGAAALLGHVFNPFLRLRGGKGVSTSAGVLLALSPVLLALSCALFLVVFVWRRRVSEASISAALLLGVTVWIWPQEPPVFALILALVPLVCWTHRENVRRILRGSEPRLEL